MIKTNLNNIEDNSKLSLPWQSLKRFYASTTLSEKVWRVVNNLLFPAAALCLGTIVNRKIRPIPVVYASYVVIALAVRKIVATVIGYVAYPAIVMYSCTQLIQKEAVAFDLLKKEGFVTQKISLHKSGVIYDATIIGHSDTIGNGKWSMHALGNVNAMEDCTEDLAKANHPYGANTLLINGPGIGRSGGYPTRYQLGAGFEAGLQFLEKEVKATHIVLEGLSLGGGMMAEAVLAHQFDTSGRVKYLAISKCTFSRLSEIATALVGTIATFAFFLTGAELDGVSGAEKLKKLNINHILIQHSSEGNKGSDGVIPDHVALAPALEQAPTRIFLLSPLISHNEGLPWDIFQQLFKERNKFFETTETQG